MQIHRCSVQHKQTERRRELFVNKKQLIIQINNSGRGGQCPLFGATSHQSHRHPPSLAATQERHSIKKIWPCFSFY